MSADEILAILRRDHSPVMPWAYHWIARDCEPAYAGVRVTLRWWRGCGEVSVCGYDQIILARDLDAALAGADSVVRAVARRMLERMADSWCET